ncbi:MAG: glutamine synthetase family protein [Thainema sp.]
MSHTWPSVIETLEEQNVRFVRVIWCDNANIIRGKAIHIGALPRYGEHGVGLSVAQQAIPVMYDAPALDSGLGPVGEVWLQPDWSTLQILPYCPSHARVIGQMVRDQQPWSICSRQFLKRMIAQAAEINLQIKAAFEPEFYLLKTQSDPDAVTITPADPTVFAATAAMDMQQPVIDAIADALVAQDIEIEQYYPESGPGQQEISVRYTDALTAADQHIVFRETVRTVAAQHGLTATFVPKIFADSAGSGCHLHFSLWRDNKNLLIHPNSSAPSPLTLPQIPASFTAGILAHLPGLMALTTPSTNSYRRLQPHLWSGAFQAWGFDNREAAIRVPSSPAPPSPTHIEVKTVDGSANPYLALGGIIAAGLDGIRQDLRLPDPVKVDPGTLSEQELRSHSISPLPRSLKQAIDAFAADSVLQTALGEPLTKAILAVRQAEWQAMKDYDLEAEVKLLLERY